MRLFVDVSGSMRGPRLIKFLEYFARFADGYCMPFDHEIKGKGPISDVVKLVEHASAKSGTDPNCLGPHLGGDGLAVIVSDGLFGNFKVEASNMVIIDPEKIKSLQKVALALTMLDDELTGS